MSDLSAPRTHIPVFNVINRYTIKGSKVRSSRISFDVADVPVVKAYGMIQARFSQRKGRASDWAKTLHWTGNRQREERRSDYTDIAVIIADCIFGDDRTSLMLAALPQASARLFR